MKLTTQPLALERPKVATAPAAPKRQLYTITFKDDNFTPESLTIKVGDVITLKNDSKDDLELAIGKHENHDSLKGFEEKVIKSSETYTFSPKETGKFTYHNHLKPKKYGNLTIE